MSNLSRDEISFLELVERRRLKHNQRQKIYRSTRKDEIKEYNKNYYQMTKEKLKEIRKKIEKEPLNINIDEIISVPKLDKRTRRGKKNRESSEIIPRFQTRKEKLEYSSITNYLKNINVINKLFNKRNLPAEVKAELKKLFNDNPDLDEELILNELTYVSNDANIKDTINILRSHYKNDNSFKTYLTVLTVITGHLKTLHKSIHQTLSKVGIFTNEKVQQIREKGELNEEEKKKLINLDETEILSNLEKLKKLDDILIYALYTLQPARRLEYRNMKITNEIDLDKLNDLATNFIIVRRKPYKFVFNDYKTYKQYGQQVIDVRNPILNDIIDKYINISKKREGDYLFSLLRDKREVIKESVFSSKISNVFKKVYGIPISERFIRISWATYFNKSNPSLYEIKEFSKLLAHSPEENMRYKKKLIDI